MPTTTFTSVPYRPSAPLTGNEAPAIYRGQNMLLRGQIGNLFFGAYQGSENLDEPLPLDNLTGVISFSPLSRTLTGAGTLFQDELHIGQMIISVNDVLSIQSIESQTSATLYKFPTTSESGVFGYKARILIPLNTQRASLFWGDVTLTDKGNLVAVGDGTLLINGSILPGDTLLATRRAQIAIYDATTDTYDVVSLGFDDVPTTVNTDVTVLATGGTKSMSPGYYSFRVAYFSDTTDGYGNPTPTLLSGGTIGYQVSATNSLIQIDFTDDIPFRPLPKATGYIIYASAFSGSSDQSKVNAIQGGWFELVRVTFEELVATSDIYTFDYVDSDLSSTLASFDNDTPPDAEFCSLFAGYLNLISTGGKGVDSFGREAATSPGPFIAPMKADNIDAYPASQSVPADKGETIIGYLNAAGRMFPMTANTLQASTPTGLPTSPFTLRPFWQRGFANPWNLMCLDSTLYGFTTKGPFRSIATGDSADASNDFASSVDAQMASWSAGYVFVAYDPKNSAICYFHSACSTNDQGYWETEIYPYSLKINDWMPRILLTETDRDMVVTGVATVHENLCFIAGGRRMGDSSQFDTWNFDSGSGDDVPWYLAWLYQDGGAELTPKIIRKLRARGQFATNPATLLVYGAFPDGAIYIPDLESGMNSVTDSDPIELAVSTSVTSYEVAKRRCKNLLMYTLRISGTSVSDGTQASLDAVHEIAVEVDFAGQMR